MDEGSLSLVLLAVGVNDHVVAPVVGLVNANCLRASRPESHVLKETMIRIADYFHQPHGAEHHNQWLSDEFNAPAGHTLQQECTEQPATKRFGPAKPDHRGKPNYYPCRIKQPLENAWLLSQSGF